MQLINVNIDRIIIHQIFSRADDGAKIKPTQTHNFTNFDAAAMTTFKQRVIDALGEDSKAVEMEIFNQASTDLPSLINKIIDQDDITFAVSSYDIAVKLNDAQTKRNIPGGIVVVFTGTQGSNPRSFLGIIKAEMHSGYERETNFKGEISLKYITDILLTPGTRLYKTAAFFKKASYDVHNVDLKSNFSVLISDYQINKADGKAAAKYFYSEFLGCGYPESSARTTKLFFEESSKFISKLSISAEERSDLLNALTTYLKVNTSPVINTLDFASNYFNDVDTRDSFKEHMNSIGIPAVSFTKNNEYIESKLKFRRISFKNNIKITAPSETFKSLINIETIDGDLDATGSPAEWTKIIIKDRIIQQE
ncbi:nucleoid-associated protein [Shewanella sp. SM21]|uniref:nucleoid-associated protein n=1 Tax=Shewanella sp. SM21 TaxID=2912793 RepID=UPI0021D7E819|nr:nucleoid-associated protein [Shewanella sp. SM21]MCU8087670.1 nucleoid-associated protein [Shewanella sp. SM21]